MGDYLASAALVGVPVLAAAAEATGSNLTPMEGWTATGLLAAVLSWVLLQHLPRKDREMDKLAIRKDRQIEALIISYEKRLAEQGVRYEASLARVTAHCEHEMAELVAQLKQSIEQRRTDN